MIQHILRIIWNERKSNILIILEFIIIFCIFWFCCDYIYYLSSQYLESHGVDIENVYIIRMGQKDDPKINNEEMYEYALLFRERAERHPDVEAVSFSIGAIPYGWRNSNEGLIVNDDSTYISMDAFRVTPEYFKVFKLKIISGNLFDDTDINAGNRVLISPNRKNQLGDDENNYSLPVHEAKEFRHHLNDENPRTVIGITEKHKKQFYNPYTSTTFYPLKKKDYNLAFNEIAIRVKPEADKNFADRFKNEMQEQLAIGPYFISSMFALKERQKLMTEYQVGGNMKSTLAITVFLIINIFLVIIGTFWSRTETRKSEIGLRIALGSSKRKVRWQMFTEVFIMLFLASIIGVYISMNLGKSDILLALGIPLADYNQAGFGTEQHVINYLLTMSFLTLIAGFAVWYPSAIASGIQPADALRAE